MKKLVINRIFIILIAAIALTYACTEDISDIRLDPMLSTSEVLSISSDGATVVGFVVAEGDGFTEKGVCYNTVTNPTTDNNKVALETLVEGATFSITLTGLDYATQYFARAYAINVAGTIYGEEMTFTTLPEVPTLTTAAISEISYTSATGGGEVTVNGGAEVTARGVCYGENPEPTVDNDKTADGTGLGAFVSNLSGLKDGTEYYLRSYATNSAGTGYGPEVVFSTLVPLNRTWYVPGSYVAASYPGFDMSDWSPDKSPQVKSGLSAPDVLEGYVYMAGTSNEWKFATKPSWDGPNYGDGGGGTLSESGGNMSSSAGYYKLTADAAAMTYTAVATEWGVIGSATPDGWNDETALSYNPELAKWTGAVSFTAGEFKFRANHDWGYNYGSSAANDTLNAGGDNIPVSEADDYAISLDLSHPLQYTYSAHRWGIIGSGTADGWNSDQNMSWDAVGGVFTATIDLVAGEIKFRANDGWDYNLGGELDALSPGGANIVIAADGNYTITLDPWSFEATVTLN